jgi:molybdopterin/thiamine biosynthesis adenylyltransferase
MTEDAYRSTAPRAKPIYPRYREAGDVFRIGAQRDLTVEIVDPEKQLWQLLDLLDGTRDAAAAVAEMLRRYPELTADDVYAAIGHLDGSRLLDDAGPCRYDTDPRYGRYVGNVNYFSHFLTSGDRRGALQDRLCDTKVCLLGLGGGGSTVLQLLAGIGVGSIRAADHDRIDLTNLNRQLIYDEAAVGRPKADAAREFVARRNGLINVEFEDCFVDAQSAGRLVAGADIVVCAVDEPAGIVQRIVSKACVDAGVPCVFGLSQVTRGRVFSIIPGESGCVDCLYLHYDASDGKWAERFRTFGDTGFRAPTLAYAPNLMRVCAELVDEVVRIRTGYLPPRSVGVQLEMDFETGTTYPLTDWAWQRDPDCPTCGAGDEEAFARRIGSPALTGTRAAA